MPWHKFVLSLLLAGVTISLAQADELTGTLKKIKDNGVIVVGHRGSSIPFSYYDNMQQPVGYSQDYASLIIAAVKQRLGIPDLPVKFLPITSQNRIPLLQNGTYDVECGSTTHTLERQKHVAFSNTIFIATPRLLTRKHSGVNDFADLAGKVVVVTAGTTSEVLLNQKNDLDKMNIRIISAKDHGDAFRTLETGRAVAFMLDDALLAGERAKAKQPDHWEIVGTPPSHEAYGCMLRKGDPAFKTLVDDTLAEAQRSGAAERSFQRWFQHPIPPKNLDLNFPLSDDIRALFKQPNDQILQ